MTSFTFSLEQLRSARQRATAAAIWCISALVRNWTRYNHSLRAADISAPH
jgi:hypothetical protein